MAPAANEDNHHNVVAAPFPPATAVAAKGGGGVTTMAIMTSILPSQANPECSHIMAAMANHDVPTPEGMYNGDGGPL